MTHSIINTEAENAGSLDVAYVTIDITSLDGAGAEQFDPEQRAGLSGADRYGVAVRGQANQSYLFRWDHSLGELAVQENVDTGDGTGGFQDVAAATAVGEVILEVTGV